MGTLVIGTSARAGFETAFGDANAGTDALVRSADQLDAGEQPLSRPFDEAVAQTILSVEGVTKVEPVVDGVAQIMTADGELLGGHGIGRASGRESVSQSVSVSVGAGSLKKK